MARKPVERVVGEPLPGKKNGYRPNEPKRISKSIQRRIHGMEADPFNEVKPPFADSLVSVSGALRSMGVNNLSYFGTFSGGGDDLLGFAAAGWDIAGSLEFVHAARHGIAANFPKTTLIEPEVIKEAAVRAAAEMGLLIVKGKTGGNDAELELDREELSKEPGVAVNRGMTYKGEKILPAVGWEETSYRLDPATFAAFRTRTNEILFGEMVGDLIQPCWGDDIRGFDPYVYMDHYDIEPGDLDCLGGAPPCSPFSAAGKRGGLWNKAHQYSEERHQSAESLFLEFERVLQAFKPKSFVTENVTELLSGEAEEMTRALAERMRADYTVEFRVMNARSYGVAQDRKRFFIQGVHKSLVGVNGKKARPKWPQRLPYEYTLGEALAYVADLGVNTPEMIEEVTLDKTSFRDYPLEIGVTWHQLKEGQTPKVKQFMSRRCHRDLPVSTMTVVGSRDLTAAGPMHPTECRKFTVPEIKVLFGNDIDFTMLGTRGQQSERLCRSVATPLMRSLALSLADVLSNSTVKEVSHANR